MKFQLPRFTWRETYAHILLLSFYFIFVGVVASLFGKFLFYGDFNVLTKEDYKFIIDVLLLAALLLPLLRKTFPELRYWFMIYFVLMFVIRSLFF